MEGVEVEVALVVVAVAVLHLRRAKLLKRRKEIRMLMP
jgi:hypothetical protein